MKAESFQVPEECDERLRLWGSYFRDRRRYMQCGSAEGRYRRHSDDLGEDVSEEVREAPKPQRPRDWVLQALETNDAIMELGLVQKWCLTYAFAYPGLPRFVVLRALKKFTKRHLTWREYLDQTDIARIRVWATLMRRAA